MDDIDLREDNSVQEEAPRQFLRRAGGATARRRARNLVSLAFSGTSYPGLNYGDAPWKPHPVENTPFSPAKTALIHIFLGEDFQLHVTRVHFDAAIGTPNEWADNEQRVSAWINYLNALPPSTLPPQPQPLPAPQPPSTPFVARLGLGSFAFNQPHHVVFYIKNKGVSYDSNIPVWFSDSLQDNVYGVRVAGPNKSFFEAEVYGVGNIDPAFSDQVIHMKNYYMIFRAGSYVPIVNGQDRVAYGININAAAQMAGGGLALPIVIDPDTGNMGEGQP
jgi:hypothetical protein